MWSHALLAERNGRKIVIAVRTVSQLTTFIRELELVKRKQPQIKTVYLVGKGSMCPLGGEGDVYRRCEGVKAFSNSLMRDRAEKGAMIPAKDPFIIQQVRRMDKEHPLLCPYYIGSKMFVQAEGVGIRMVPSTELPEQGRPRDCKPRPSAGTLGIQRRDLPVRD